MLINNNSGGKTSLKSICEGVEWQHGWSGSMGGGGARAEGFPLPCFGGSVSAV